MEQTEQLIPLKNVTEEIVQGLVGFLLHGPAYPTYCDCDLCGERTCAIALNNLQSFYVATAEERDRAFAELKQPKNMEQINKQVIHAIHVVGQNKHKK
ncbi:late competence development ComFB family protein [Kurthia senegalensis]|uniref:late competence development ComFB family protein n=1 Tax=Kurthia senegalensis TaxID=1033740 RepID=UPI0002881007|nr:late competence development ComFB family protein [Kurthia senegalensis]